MSTRDPDRRSARRLDRQDGLPQRLVILGGEGDLGRCGLAGGRRRWFPAVQFVAHAVYLEIPRRFGQPATPTVAVHFGKIHHGSVNAADFGSVRLDV